MKVKNLWQVSRHDDNGKIASMQGWVSKGKPTISKQAEHQPADCMDLSSKDRKRFEATNQHSLAVPRHALGQCQRHSPRSPAAAEAAGRRGNHRCDVWPVTLFRRRPEKVSRLHEPPPLHLAQGHHSLSGKAGPSGVQNNEFIVSRPEQNELRYLVEFYTTKKS